MRALLIALLLFSVAAQAEPYEDGVAAYKREDYQTALQLLSWLADRGDSNAQYYLGVMYANGEGTSQDRVRAHKWCILAAAQLSTSDKKWRDEAEIVCDMAEFEMTPAQRAEAAKLAREWKPRAK